MYFMTLSHKNKKCLKRGVIFLMRKGNTFYTYIPAYFFNISLRKRGVLKVWYRRVARFYLRTTTFAFRTVLYD